MLASADGLCGGNHDFPGDCLSPQPMSSATAFSSSSDSGQMSAIGDWYQS